jgi:hypothetical protein
MSSNIVFVGWNRSIHGREATSAAHFQEFAQYVGGLQQAGTIKSFEAVLLDPHGGDLNGFLLIRGESVKLDAVMASDAWQTHMTRAGMHLDGLGAIRGATGELVMERMAMWSKLIPA